MKITTTKIIRELEKKGYGKSFMNSEAIYPLIKSTRDIIDEILREQKGITIKK